MLIPFANIKKVLSNVTVADRVIYLSHADLIIMQILRKIMQLNKDNIMPPLTFTNPEITIKGIEQVKPVKNACIAGVIG